jgi:hypothetical protein
MSGEHGPMYCATRFLESIVLRGVPRPIQQKTVSHQRHITGQISISERILPSYNGANSRHAERIFLSF